MSPKASKKDTSTANLGFEAKLWLAADKLRNNMDAAEYKHVVLGLIFLKYISDSFEEHRAKLLAGEGDYAGANPEDPDEYKAENVFRVPAEARWAHLQANAKQPTIGKTVDDAMAAIERDNPRLKGVLPKDYARPALDKHRLGELIDLIATIELTAAGSGEQSHKSVDLLGRVYVYFLTRFASAEGRNGGQFYTPSCVVRCLVEMLAPYKGRIYDPACGSGGMFVQSEKFVESHGGRIGDISIYGQESNATTRRLAIMNLAIRGIEADIGKEHADTFRNVQHPDLRADYVLANPPFNDSDWFRKDDDVRWAYGVPPKGNANFAWVQHFIHHLAPASQNGGGMAGFVLANGSMSSNQSGEGEIRKAIIEADLVDCMVALPGQLFYSTQIPVCLWFLTKSKAANPTRGFRERQGETLFIDAHKLGTLIDRVHRELTDDDLAKIAGTYHRWRGDDSSAAYEDIPGFCKSADKAGIAAHGHVLTPGRYVGAEEVDDPGLVPSPERAKPGRGSAEDSRTTFRPFRAPFSVRADTQGVALGYLIVPRWGTGPQRRTTVESRNVERPTRLHAMRLESRAAFPSPAPKGRNEIAQGEAKRHPGYPATPGLVPSPERAKPDRGRAEDSRTTFRSPTPRALPWAISCGPVGATKPSIRAVPCLPSNKASKTCTSDARPA